MEFFILSIIGAALVMDTSVAFQVLVSQPIIASTIIGWIMGDPLLGLEFGLLLQLLWIGHLPVGAHIIPAGNFASIVSTVVAISLTNANPELKSFIILITIFYVLVLSYTGAKVVKLNRNYNIVFFDKALKSIESGNLRHISMINFSALSLHFFIIFLLILSGIYFGIKAGSVLINSVPVEWNYYARYTEYAILGVGVGLTVPLYNGFKRILIITLGSLSGVLLYFI